MRLAIMQPYLFPYLGYFQLMRATDVFVFLDDVPNGNRKWLFGNNVLLGSRPHRFSIPIEKASQKTLIRDLKVVVTSSWRRKFLETIRHAYSKAVFFEVVFPMLETVANTNSRFLLGWLENSMAELRQFLGMTPTILLSSSMELAPSFVGQDRIIEICKRQGATTYINPLSGRALYRERGFAEVNVDLRFLKFKQNAYRQFSGPFLPNLSIIDVLMFNDTEQVEKMLGSYAITDLVSNGGIE